MSEREPALNINHVAPDRPIPIRCSLCERRGRTCTVLKTSQRCLACVEDEAVCSFTAPSIGEWDKLNRAEKKVKEELAVVATWLKSEVSNLQLQLAQIAAARLLQTLDGENRVDTRAKEASAQLLQEESTAYELMVTMLGRRARLRKQQKFLEVRGKEMLRRGLAVLDEEDAMDWEENGEQEEDEEAEMDQVEENNTKSLGDTKLENDPAEPEENMGALGEAFSSDNIPPAFLDEMEPSRQDREEFLKLRLTQLSKLLQLEEEEANLPVRFSRMIRLGLHSLEELDRIEEGEREAEIREN